VHAYTIKAQQKKNEIVVAEVTCKLQRTDKQARDGALLSLLYFVQFEKRENNNNKKMYARSWPELLFRFVIFVSVSTTTTSTSAAATAKEKQNSMWL
jgi:hypothetical protein